MINIYRPLFCIQKQRLFLTSMTSKLLRQFCSSADHYLSVHIFNILYDSNMKFSEITQKGIIGNIKVSNTITIQIPKGPFCHDDGHIVVVLFTNVVYTVCYRPCLLLLYTDVFVVLCLVAFRSSTYLCISYLMASLEDEENVG